jgi:hypothetical protein
MELRNRHWTRAALSVLLATGCSAEVQDFEAEGIPDEVDFLGAPLCNNQDGVRSVMTALAVAAGQEIRRWLPERDFQFNYSTNRLEMSQYAYPRCADRKCKGVQAILDMQSDAANGIMTYGNIPLNVGALRSSLRSSWEAQMACNNAGNCPAENHYLSFTHAENGSCDQKFFFDHKKVKNDVVQSAALSNPGQLVNKLMFVGYPWNTMLNFYLRDGQVSVDPTYGLNEGGVSSSGSCSAACTRVSATNIAGQCCSCNGSTKSYVKSSFSASVYLCQ